MKIKYPVLTVLGGIYDKELGEVDDKLTNQEGELIYIIIDSFGGDPSCGYRIMRLIQAKYKKIVVVVPGEAYSTATLMALGADEIYMRQSACLGPLDIQIKHPTDGSMISSLEIRDTLNTLAGSLMTYAEDFFESLKGPNVQLGKKDAADLSMRTATELIKPIAEKINPIDLQRSTRSSKIGQKYAESLLVSRMMKNNKALARLVSRYLANNYDSHGYAITLEEASDLLGLNVEDVAKLPEWDRIKDVYRDNRSSGRGIYFDLFEVEVDDKQEKTQNVSNASAKIKTQRKGGES